jgi:small conductance mechanosensitive channel
MARALDLVRELLAQHPHVLKDPAPIVGISGFADSSVTIAIKPWVPVPQYASVQAELNRGIMERFRSAQIEIPFPQREVRLLSGTPSGS